MHVGGYLAEQRRGDVAARMERDRCDPAVRVPELFVRPALAHLRKTVRLEERDETSAARGEVRGISASNFVGASSGRLRDARIGRTTRAGSDSSILVGKDTGKAVGHVRSTVITFWHSSGNRPQFAGIQP